MKRFIFVLAIVVFVVLTYGAINLGQKNMMGQARVNYYAIKERQAEMIQHEGSLTTMDIQLKKEIAEFTFRIEEMEKRLEKISNTLISMNQRKLCEVGNGERVVEIEDRVGKRAGTCWYGGGR